MANKIGNFLVHDDDMLSDHFPVEIHVNAPPFSLDKQKNPQFNYKKADWPKFKNELSNKKLTPTDNVETLWDEVTRNILEAAEMAIPTKTSKQYKTTLPPDLLHIVEIRKRIRRKLDRKQKTENRNAKKKGVEPIKICTKEYNKLTSLVRLGMSDHRDKCWVSFLERVGPNPISSRPFWQKINKFRGGGGSKSLPLLKHNNTEYSTDRGKSELFGEILKETFKINSEPNDLAFTEKIDQFINNRRTKKKVPPLSHEKITKTELIYAIKKTKTHTSPGPDKISNHMLKNLPDPTLEELVSIFNLSMKSGHVPSAAKISTIIMIPKKTDNPNSPLNYRPISLTSCLIKLLERIMCNRLYKFLEENKFLIEEQSGFRRNRRTADNLYFLTQKTAESFNRNNKHVLAIFFDICKAFDKVWHAGLIYKLSEEAKAPSYLVDWIENFLLNRKFSVNVNGQSSELKDIEAGVPQGSVLSPILFSVFINDIPIEKKPNESQSTLFADDLATAFIFKSRKGLDERVRAYLKKIEAWLTKWKMKMAAKKCNYMIFATRHYKNTKPLKLTLFGDDIKRENDIRFLGMTLDSHLNFELNVAEIRKKCESRLNILKILSNRKWNLRKQTLLGMYKSLIGSVLDYAFPSINSMSPTTLTNLQSVQNRALRVIYKRYTDTNDEVEALASSLELLSVSNRLSELNERYITSALFSKNPLIARLVGEYVNGFSSRGEARSTPLSNLPLISFSDSHYLYFLATFFLLVSYILLFDLSL